MNQLIKKILFSTSFIFFVATIFCQNPIPLQVSMPVFYKKEAYAYLQSDKPPLANLCGIAMLYLDTSKVNDELIISGLNDPIIWLDRVGISTKVSFIVSDSNGVKSLELLYANNSCTVNILSDDRLIGYGSITKDYGRYIMRLVGDESWSGAIEILLAKLNNHLLRLHTKQQRKVLLSSHFDRESLSVILGPDLSFDTEFDLLRFDETLRNRIKKIAGKAYLEIESGGQNRPLNKSLEGNAKVVHEAQKTPGTGNVMHGIISTIFKMEGDKNYLFLKPQQDYLIKIGYKYEHRQTGPGRLMIDKFSIKNIENDDFISMDIFDMAGNGLPILYVDLIKGVVMEDKGAWKPHQIISVIQDVFKLVALPDEH